MIFVTKSYRVIPDRCHTPDKANTTKNQKAVHLVEAIYISNKIIGHCQQV